MRGEEDLSLSADALAALQEVVGGSKTLVDLLTARGALESEEEEEEEEQVGESGKEDKVSHLEYFKARFPERFKDPNESCFEPRENPVAVLSMDDSYVQKLLVAAFEERAEWKVLTEIPEHGEVDLHWGEYEHIDWFSERFLSGKCMVSCYYNRKGLIRKGLLANSLEKWFLKHPEEFRFTPKSFIISSSLNGDVNVESMMKEVGFPGFPGDWWILKPSVTNQAQGIRFVSSVLQLEDAFKKADEIELAGGFVLQKYIANPFLVDKRKFHLRVFALLKGNLEVFVSPDFLAICSLEQYSAVDMEKTRAHLTNIAHQQVLSVEDEYRCMRSFDEIAQSIVDEGFSRSREEAETKIKETKDKVMGQIRKVVSVASTELTFQAATNCFELFGFDFMLDDEWNCWFLEANAEPDLSKAGNRLQGLIDNIIRATLEIVTSDKCNAHRETNFVKVFDKFQKKA